jgi:hypothetical protein
LPWRNTVPSKFEAPQPVASTSSKAPADIDRVLNP